MGLNVQNKLFRYRVVILVCICAQFVLLGGVIFSQDQLARNILAGISFALALVVIVTSALQSRYISKKG